MRVSSEIHITIQQRRTIATYISHDAGNFVCNQLYYSVLQHIQAKPQLHQCLFIHVPLLNENNLATIGQDFAAIVQKLAQ